MKKCPYCAEDIQDEAILCRYCGSALAPAAGGTGVGAAELGNPPDTAAPSDAPAESPGTAVYTTGATGTPSVGPTADAGQTDPGTVGGAATAPPAMASGEAAGYGSVGPDPTPAGPPPMPAQVTYSYTGYRFVLGYTDASYAIWDRAAPTTPVRTYPRTDDGWREAWTQYAAWEPHATPVSAGPSAPVWQGSAGVAPRSRTNGMAIASLVLGIVWIWGITSVLALIFGFIALRDIDASQGAQEGRGLAIAGIVLGFVGLAGLIIVIIAAAASTNP